MVEFAIDIFVIVFGTIDASVIVCAAIFASVTASSAIFAVETEPSANLAAVTALAAILAVVIVPSEGTPTVDWNPRCKQRINELTGGAVLNCIDVAVGNEYAVVGWTIPSI